MSLTNPSYTLARKALAKQAFAQAFFFREELNVRRFLAYRTGALNPPAGGLVVRNSCANF